MKNRDQETGEYPPSSHEQRRFSRRMLLRGGAGAAVGILTATGAKADFVRACPSHSLFQPANATADVLVFPRPGSRTASPRTQISFRNVSIDQIGVVRATGSRSGDHTGVLQPHSDGRGASFLPDAPFWASESVTVQTGLRISGVPGASFTFTTAQPGLPAPAPFNSERARPNQPPRTFRSRPDLLPPAMSVTMPISRAGRGHLFLGAKVPGGQNGALILDEQGELVWFHPLEHDIASLDDVRVQQYQGKPVLTWWEGTGPVGYGLGHYVIRDTSYRPIATIHPGNGYGGGDLHEFLLTPYGTALIPIYSSVRWDLTAAGGPNIGTAIDGIVQEIDIATGLVLFEWHSLDHIAVEESHGKPSSNPAEAFDYLHLNSIDALDDGSLLISGRHTWSIYKIDRHTGEVVWRLNGKRSDFAMGPGASVAYQHDARMHAGDLISIFDNHASQRGHADHSRGVVLKLDMKAMTANLEREYIHSTGILSVSQGNLQLLPNGNAFVGWGSAPVLSEFDADGNLIFNERFPESVMSYRAYRLPWTGYPDEKPAIAISAEEPDLLTIYASWNGATEIASWQILAGPYHDRLTPLTSAPKTGFETAMTVRTNALYIAARALNAKGTVLGTSTAVSVDAVN